MTTFRYARARVSSPDVRFVGLEFCYFFLIQLLFFLIQQLRPFDLNVETFMEGKGSFKPSSKVENVLSRIVWHGDKHIRRIK